MADKIIQYPKKFASVSEADVIDSSSLAKTHNNMGVWGERQVMVQPESLEVKKLIVDFINNSDRYYMVGNVASKLGLTVEESRYQLQYLAENKKISEEKYGRFLFYGRLGLRFTICKDDLDTINELNSDLSTKAAEANSEKGRILSLKNQNLVLTCLSHATPKTALQIRKETGLSEHSLSKTLAELGDKVVFTGKQKKYWSLAEDSKQV